MTLTLQHLFPLPKHNTSPYIPQFHIKQCFVDNRMPREPWQPKADGIVEMVGYAHYLVMYQDEADRRSGGAKFGWQEEMQSFDKRYHPITCPTEWAHNEGKKPREGHSRIRKAGRTSNQVGAP